MGHETWDMGHVPLGWCFGRFYIPLVYAPGRQCLHSCMSRSDLSLYHVALVRLPVALAQSNAGSMWLVVFYMLFLFGTLSAL